MTRERDDAPAPWKRSNPKKKSGAKPKKLSKAQIAEARARARKAGRRYPNLVDNMAVARKRSSTKKGGTAKKRTSTKTPAAGKKRSGVKKKSGVRKKSASPRRVKKSR
jgi:hypothetical protein